MDGHSPTAGSRPRHALPPGGILRERPGTQALSDDHVPTRQVQPGCLYGYGNASAEAAAGGRRSVRRPVAAPHAAAGPDRQQANAHWNGQAGKRLGFEVRVRPVVRRTDKAECRPGREWDAFQLEATQHPKGEMPRGREEVYTDWLARQLETHGSARLESASLQSFQRTRAVRKQHSRYSEGPDALMRGVLTVTDAVAFGKLLTRGVGRHRSYGYGMLLLRPAGRS